MSLLCVDDTLSPKKSLLKFNKFHSIISFLENGKVNSLFSCSMDNLCSLLWASGEIQITI